MVEASDGTPARSLPVRGREHQLAAVDALLDRAAGGQGGALAVLGGPGLGKTTLLDAAARSADGFRVLRASGSEAESELTYAGLHQLLGGLTERAEYLADGHRQALRAALAPGTAGAGPVPSFALHAAVHALLTAASTEQPTLCYVDAVHDLDEESLATLVFAARRACSVPLAFAFAADAGTSGADRLSELPHLRADPLDDATAEQVLQDHLGPGIPRDVLDSIVELAGGNPLALTELAASVTAEQHSGPAAPPSALPPDSRLCRTVRRRLARLRPDVRLLVLLAALDGRLDRSTISRLRGAARGLDDAVDSGLLSVHGDTVRLSGDLLPGAVVGSMGTGERKRAHRMLARATDPARDRYRWTWHRAATVSTPAPALAHELESVAESLRRSRRYRDAAVAGERAAALTAEGEDRQRRLVSAASDHWANGRPRRARTVLRSTGPFVHDGLACSAATLAGEIELRRGDPSVAAADLLSTARRFASTDSTLAARTLLLAGEASCVAGDNARYCATALDAAHLREAEEGPAVRLVLEHFTAMSATFSGRHTAAAGPLRNVVLLGEAVVDPTAKTLASQAAFTLGDAPVARDMALQAVAGAKATGNLARAPWALVYASMSALLSGQHAQAVSSSMEGLHLAESLGQSNCAIDHLTILAMLAALQGDRETTELRLDNAASAVLERGLGRPGALASWAAACADLADDRPADALEHFRRMTAGRLWHYTPIRVMAIPHFVEAAVRCGHRDSASRALEHFEPWASTTGGLARLALAHRCRALLAEDEGAATEHFAEAIELHRRAGASYDLANTELLFAYRLRRHRRPGQARELLGEAVRIFDDLDAHRLRDRARRELRACGHPVEQPSGHSPGELTPQQAHIAELVAEGATNREIATRLFISHRTVDHHLRNIFARLGIRSRVELATLYR
ncbi:AAA family ATPase [Haloechinothrix sp. YIM 98757]|uniref:AAA family ATPase n=1 Tax=Haloechinothrix aidingensis TaxID=2752311 RepID=A0A838AB31_9PSEU|nr:LuxR family transcriptional regulator [Haloechinothrix aidingensis]MBA0126443.1 AAA family ATPase [Haloechinothrix aidingensis]